MNFKLLQQSTIPLFITTLIIALFYLQFTKIYPYIIEHFTEDKLSTLYAHLFIYTFLIQLLFVSLTNIINNLILKSKVFVISTIIVLLIFYILSYSIIEDTVDYFMISHPLGENSILGMILFIVGTIGYSLLSIGILFLKKHIPYSYIFIFTLLALAYSAWFLDTYCYPIEEIVSKLKT